ncbi:SRPBCC family protein [Dyella koreensis]|uniref:SRPBCC domain-containing protein n=1 Tax=Dyella koreensis TaxID=311235 RepID=A0ABW8KDB4_9GAMM
MNLPSDDSGDIPDHFSEEVVLEKPAPVVWKHLVSHRSMREWLGGDDYAVEVDTTWALGSAIVIRGMHHLPFENRGVVLAFRPCEALSFTHLSSLSRLPDQPASYTKLSFELEAGGSRTLLRFEASGFPTIAIYRHLHFYWMGTLDIFKRYTESR